MLKSLTAGLGSSGEDGFLVRSRGLGPLPSFDALRVSPVEVAVEDSIVVATPIAVAAPSASAPGTSVSGDVAAAMFPPGPTPIMGDSATLAESMGSAWIPKGSVLF
jgi:hypothetical protein